MGVNTRILIRHVPSPHSRPLALTIISAIIGLLAINPLIITLSDFLTDDHWYGPDYIPWIWQSVLLALLSYGLFTMRAWARWTVLVVYTVLFMLLTHELLLGAFRNVDARYPWWAINHTANFTELVVTISIAFLVLLLLLFYLTRPNVRKAFQQDEILSYHPIVTGIGWVVAGASAIGLSWGLYRTYDLLYYITDRPSPQAFPFEYFVIPAIILLLIGIGFIRNETWARWVGWVLVAVLVPYLVLFYFG